MRGMIGAALFVGLWQVVTSFAQWTGVSLPIVAQLPPPSSVLHAFLPLVRSHGFWQSAYLSFVRVLWGFIAAMVVGPGMAVAVPSYVVRRFIGGLDRSLSQPLAGRHTGPW